MLQYFIHFCLERLSILLHRVQNTVLRLFYDELRHSYSCKILERPPQMANQVFNVSSVGHWYTGKDQYIYPFSTFSWSEVGEGSNSQCLSRQSSVLTLSQILSLIHCKQQQQQKPFIAMVIHVYHNIHFKHKTYVSSRVQTSGYIHRCFICIRIRPQ